MLLKFFDGDYEFLFNGQYNKNWNANEQGIKIVFLDDLIKKINELATPAPQESVDADGWCWDMKSMPIEEEVLLLVSCEGDRYRTVGKRYSMQHDIEHNLSLSWGNCDFYELAWRPLPKLPTGGSE